MNKSKMTCQSVDALYQQGEKIAMLTCYDATFAHIFSAAGVDILLVGDSLGMVTQGHQSTLPVTLEQMCYHIQNVARAKPHSLILADLPFASYQASPAQAFQNAALLMAAGAEMVKLEGGAFMAETIAFLTQRGIPVCAHIGLLPQSVHTLGGYRVQGKNIEQAISMQQDALAVTAAGAKLLLMEAIPATLAAQITQQSTIPTIGIGAGAACNGQVLVSYDMLGIVAPNGRTARFVKNFLSGTDSILSASQSFVQAVKEGSFPAAEHCF